MARHESAARDSGELDDRDDDRDDVDDEVDRRDDEDDEPSGDWRYDRLDPELRTVAVVVVSASAIAWWPAFTLGAYGRVFFDQMLALWAVSTAAFIVAVLVRHTQVPPGRRAAMLLPTGWLILAYLAPTGTPGDWEEAVFWTAAIITILWGPLLAWFLIRIMLSDYTRLPRRRRVAAIGVVIFIAAVSFVLGRTNEYFLTCNDFTVSGNYAPSTCTADSQPLP